MTLYPSVRAARASHTRLRQLGASRTGFYPSLNLRSSFAQPSLKVRRKLGGSSEKQVEAGGV